jgi:hypothetical protein
MESKQLDCSGCAPPRVVKEAGSRGGRYTSTELSGSATLPCYNELHGKR